MTDDDKREWGPWIEHDGKGCPCIGMWVNAKYKSGDFLIVRAGQDFNGTEEVIGSSWHWGFGWDEIIRYRIRKPRGMKLLENLLQNLPQDDMPKLGELEVI